MSTVPANDLWFLINLIYDIFYFVFFLLIKTSPQTEISVRFLILISKPLLYNKISSLISNGRKENFTENLSLSKT